MLGSKTEKVKADALKRKGWGIIPPDQYRIDIEKEFFLLWEEVGAYTMTSFERGYALYKAVEYVCSHNIPGDFAECGVWRGGSCMLMAKTLLRCKDTERKIYLYDTFTGMSYPGENDYIAWNGKSVKKKVEEAQIVGNDPFASWAVGEDEVANNLAAV